jgi:predicted protein tyrosine phosphatase
MNVLFVCSRNQWRSRTAETIFCKNQKHVIRSAGTASDARIKISLKLFEWADIIFVMEKKHKDQLRDKYGFPVEAKDVFILDVPDEYPYMDPELIEILQTSVQSYLK